jgi:hypothetical protein
MGRLMLRLLGTPEVSHNVHSLDDSASFSASLGTSENHLCHICSSRSGGWPNLPSEGEEQHRYSRPWRDGFGYELIVHVEGIDAFVQETEESRNRRAGRQRVMVAPHDISEDALPNPG